MFRWTPKTDSLYGCSGQAYIRMKREDLKANDIETSVSGRNKVRLMTRAVPLHSSKTSSEEEGSLPGLLREYEGQSESTRVEGERRWESTDQDGLQTCKGSSGDTLPDRYRICKGKHKQPQKNVHGHKVRTAERIPAEMEERLWHTWVRYSQMMSVLSMNPTVWL